MTLFLSILTVIAQTFIVLTLLLMMAGRLSVIKTYLAKYLDALLFIATFIATSGSLYFSLIANYAPCELCWYQRIAMYPLVILFGLALYWREKIIYRYSHPFVVVGWLIAVYHNYIYYQGSKSTFCSINSHTSCITPYFTIFGYITIPVMAVTAFSLLGVLLLLVKTEKR